MADKVLHLLLTVIFLAITAASVMLGFMLLGICPLSWESYLGSILLVVGFRFTINIKQG